MTVKKLTVTVAIPTIPGREALLERALASVAAQRRRPEKILVERDPDRTGAAATRNRLLHRVRTDVICWLDDDDTLGETHVASCLRVLGLDPDVDLVYPRPRMVGGKDPTATSFNGMWRLPWGVRFGPEQEAHLRTYGSFIPMTHAVRTEAVRKAGGFPEGRMLDTGRFQGEDERYLIALLDAGARFEHLDKVTWEWHVHRENTAGRGSMR